MHFLHHALSALLEHRDLSREEAARAFQIIMHNGATPAQTAALLIGLRMKGETAEEIAGAAEAMRAKMVRIQAPAGAIDTCGTGGDGQHTYNISTAVALVAAACGVPVAKHGNRSVSSVSGSADVLQELGLNLNVSPAEAEGILQRCGIVFLMAPLYHPAVRYVAPIRQELGVRTIFNLLGPLCNPAGVKRQLIGVYDRRWVRPVAEVLKALGSEHAWVVHGEDGGDEISLRAPTLVCELKDGALREFTLQPETFGIPAEIREQSLRGGAPESNAKALIHLLNGAQGAYRASVLVNAAAALIVAGRATALQDGMAMAAQAIDSTLAKQKLAELIYCSNPSLTEAAL